MASVTGTISCTLVVLVQKGPFYSFIFFIPCVFFKSPLSYDVFFLRWTSARVELEQSPNERDTQATATGCSTNQCPQGNSDRLNTHPVIPRRRHFVLRCCFYSSMSKHAPPSTHEAFDIRPSIASQYTWYEDGAADHSLTYSADAGSAGTCYRVSVRNEKMPSETSGGGIVMCHVGFFCGSTRFFICSIIPLPPLTLTNRRKQYCIYRLLDTRSFIFSCVLLRIIQ